MKNAPNLKNDRLKLINHKDVRFITAMLRSEVGTYLTGGAVIDIMEGRHPKDYDLYHAYPGKLKLALENAHCQWIRESDTAITYMKGTLTIQILKETDEDKLGDFTISKAMFNLNKGTLDIDELSYESKVLTPFAVKDINRVMNCLSRIPHWRDKGYTLPDDIYFELLNKVSKKLKSNGLFGFFSKKETYTEYPQMS